MLLFNMVDEHTMMAGKSRSERLSVLVRRQEQIAARIKELEAQVANEKRKADTHRKIVLGAVVLNRASAHPGPARDVVRDAVRHMSRRDRDAFDEMGLDWLADVVEAAKARDKQAAEAAPNSAEGDDHGE